MMPDVLLFLRCAIGYPSMMVGGFILGVIAYERMRKMIGRRRIYQALTSTSFALAWVGSTGMIGVVQYGKFFTPLPVPMAAVSMLFSCGIVWLGLSMASLAVLVLIEEFVSARARKASSTIVG